MAKLILLPGKERSAFRRHPWLFAGSVGRLEGRARPGDTVVLAGKGHERYQVIGTEKRPFDERAIAEAALRALGVL